MDKIDLNALSQSWKLCVLGVAAIGAFKAAKVSAKSSYALLKYFVLPRRNMQARYGANSWAVVTGASDGIGKQYAIELAKEGFNIVLMARNKAKTEAVSQDI